MEENQMSNNDNIIQRTQELKAAPKPKTPGTVMKSILEGAAIQEQFRAVLKDKAPAFMASVIDLYSSDAMLAKCNPGDVIRECMKAAALDLPINKALGFAYIVPYGDEPTFVPGWRAYVQLAKRSGVYRHINADCVYAGEAIERDRLRGTLQISGERTNDIVVGYFAFLEELNGFEHAVYMTKEEVEAWGKRYSPSYDRKSSAWQTHFNEMGKKTVVRQLLKNWGTLSVEYQNMEKHEADGTFNDRDAIEIIADKHEPDMETDRDTGEVLGDTKVADEGN
jgi:recombination protein RecT